MTKAPLAPRFQEAIDEAAMRLGAVDSEAYLARALEAIETSGIRPDALVFTGDLADHGESEAYDRIRALVEDHAMLERSAEPMLRAREVLRAEYDKLHYYVSFKAYSEQQEFQRAFEPVVLG